MLNERLIEAINTLSSEEQYKLQRKIEKENSIFASNDTNNDSNILNIVVDSLLEATTIVAKIFHII